MKIPAVVVIAIAAIGSTTAQYQYCDLMALLPVAAGKNAIDCNAATGLDIIRGIFPIGDQAAKMCVTPSCQSLITEIATAIPTECLLNDKPVRQTYVDAFTLVCSPGSTAAPTPTPTSATPRPTPAPSMMTPMPTTPSPTPAATTMTPAPTTPRPTPAPTTMTPAPTTPRPTPVPTTATPVPTTATPAPTTAAPPLNGRCGNQQVGAQACASGQYCQPWNPTDYFCRSIATTCGVQETGIDYSGDDLATVQLTLPEDCCAKCATTVGCTGYTFVNYNADGKAYCYLKKGPGTKTSVVGAVSSTITPAKCMRQFPGVDFYGSDLSAVYGVTSTACCEACATTSGCKAYTYVGSSGSCYLKSGSSDRRTGAGVVSGLLNLIV